MSRFNKDDRVVPMDDDCIRLLGHLKLIVEYSSGPYVCCNDGLGRKYVIDEQHLKLENEGESK